MNRWLLSGSNWLQVAKKTWMGKWDPKKDREPDKKNEVAFKEYLIAKYERRSWYKSAADIKKEEQQASPTTDQTKLPTPTTSVKVHVYVCPFARSWRLHV